MNLNEYQKRVEDTWERNQFDIERIILGICGESGEIAELFKKYYRGDYENNYEEFLKKVDKEIGDLSYYIAKLCNQFGSTWEKIMEENIAKLASRKERGVIKGSGSNR